MADEVRTEDAEKEEGKKLPITAKIPLDAILLVAVPFVVFVILFLHVMGFLPPQPLRVNVIAPAATAGQEETVAQPEQPEQQVESGALEKSPEESAQIASEETVAAEEPKEEAASSRAETEAPKAEPQVASKEAAQQEQLEQARKESDRQAKLKQLAKVYEQMKASSVAAIVTNMSDEEAIEVLANMKPRNAAKVLAALDPERAAKLSRLLTE